MSLSGKAALVTGAGQGIGRACAFALAEAGARIAVFDLKQESADATVATLPNRAQHLAIAGNVAESAAVKAAFAQ
ncbi:MAG: SDR family NAD(P)-dependent oxidoreductase, partial [Gammaproteobacteria bacterium]|nr:SDR family NAD(P)-dependent oxidoreductase [Gammaproteobacteria bacterium]